MTTSTSTIRFDELPTKYEGLVLLHMPRPIHNEIELESATELIDLMAGHDLSPDQEDYLDLVSDLVAKYEQSTRPPADPITPVDVLTWLMKEHGMNVTDLGKLLGDRSLGSRILSGERSLSKKHIRIVSERFKISPAGLI